MPKIKLIKVYDAGKSCDYCEQKKYWTTMMKPIKNKVIKINSSHSLIGSDMEIPPIRGGMPMYGWTHDGKQIKDGIIYNGIVCRSLDDIRFLIKREIKKII